ncbi:MAG: methyltransferase domain-containing protein [Acidimicrobiaceae bacterium]|nr:methyltransferase domain-containing protein [Acidimicrobiaceae bacterium]
MAEPLNSDVEEERERLLNSWEDAASGWGRQADSVRQRGLPVAEWMLDHAGLQPGQRVLELAAGPGDIGFMAAERILPGGTLVSSDAAEAMLEVARERAAEQGIENVSFRQLQLEWIDLETASVDVVLCRWGVMLTVDPGAALQECRRVLVPGGRAVLAVWDTPEFNPWATVPFDAMVKLGLLEEPAPGRPGMFSLAAPGKFKEMLEEAGFVEVTVEPVGIARVYDQPLEWLGETVDCSQMFGRAWRALDDDRRREVRARLDAAAREFADADGTIRIPGRSLAAVAHA